MEPFKPFKPGKLYEYKSNVFMFIKTVEMNFKDLFGVGTGDYMVKYYHFLHNNQTEVFLDGHDQMSEFREIML